MMTKTQKEHLTELSLILALPKLVAKEIKQKSRTASLFDRITKYSSKTIEYFPPTGREEIVYSWNRLNNFFINMQWTEDLRLETAMIISFLLGLIDGSSFRYPQSILDALNDTWLWLTREESEELDTHIAEAEKALEVWKNGK